MLTEQVNEYRIECWHRTGVWHWRVSTDSRRVMRGTATSRDAARISARDWVMFQRRQRFVMMLRGVG